MNHFNNQPPVVVIGSGGHARVLLDCLQVLRRDVLFVTDIDPQLAGKKLLGVEVKGNDELISDLDPMEVQLVNGMGSIGVPQLRKKIHETWVQRGYQFATVIHPSAVVGRDVEIEPGVQIMAGAVVQTGTRIATNSIINTSASIDHDCEIAAHCHLAPKSTLSGSVRVGTNSHIGTAACVIQGVQIGSQCVVGAGATVINDLPDLTVAVGTPAKPINSKFQE